MELKTFRPVIKYLNQIACFIASWHAMNSAFIVDEATIVCLVFFQDTAPLARRKIYYKVDFLLSTQLANFESE